MKKKIKLLSALALSAAAVGALASCAGILSSQDSVTTKSLASAGASHDGRTIYVSTDGDENVDGTDVTKPTTFYHAHTNAKPGDVILLNEGIYKTSEKQSLGVRPQGAPSNYPVVTGTYDNYITIMPNPENTDRVIFDFSDMPFSDKSRGIQIYSNYWYIRDIEVYGAGDNGMYVAGSHNIIENCLFYGNRDTGLQLGRAYEGDTMVDSWPTCNLIKNCTSFANYDYDTYGENADGFAAKLTVGYGNVFDGCVASRNSDDGWDLFAKIDTGDIGTVIIYNSVSFENGFLPFKHFREGQDTNLPASELELTYDTLNGDGIGFKLGGSTMKGNVIVKNSMAFDNKLHGIGDNSNPGVIQVSNFTAFNNCAGVNDDGSISDTRGIPNTQNKSNNIDLARSIASYNSYYGILSYINNQKDYTLANDSSYNKDAFRGSTAYSIFNTSYLEGEKYRAFTGWVDGSSYKNATDDLAFNDGVEFDRGLFDSDFVSLESYNAITDMQLDNTSYTAEYEEVLKNSQFRDNLAAKTNDIHDDMRNEDNSVNTGDHLKLAASDLLTYCEGNPIGAVLYKSSYDEYDHYGIIDFYNEDFGVLNEEQINVKSALTICEAITRYDATYQDFRLPKLLHNVDISWESSDPNVVSIESSEEYSLSWSAFSWARINVPDNDTKVVLTATATSGKITESKQIEITVKGRHQTLGDVVSTSTDVIRVNKYGSFIAPRVYPIDNSSIVASELPLNKYDMKYTITYAESGKSKAYTIAKDVDNVQDYIYTSVGGVYTVTATATLKSDTQYISSYTYKVYVVDLDCDIDFIGDRTIALNQDGFTVTGELSNIEGNVIAVTSNEKLTINTASELLAMPNVQKYRITTDSVVAKFEADNKTVSSSNVQYYLYYAVVNGNESNGGNQVYESQIDVANISTKDQFHELGKSGTYAGKSTATTTIYSLTTDLDFKDYNYSVTSDAKTFSGLFRGNGHTISNITIDTTSDEKIVKTVNVFSKVTDGTIMDVKFDNIKLAGNAKTAKKIAIIGDLQGGYVYNVHATRIAASGRESVGGLIGQVTGGINYISQCSLINPYIDYRTLVGTNAKDETIFVVPEEYKGIYATGLDYFNSTNKYKIAATNKYAGGIIGNAQKDTDPKVFNLYVSDCYVDAVIGDGNDGGGGNTGLLISRIKNESAVYYSEITHNFVKGLVISNGQYNAGIVGDFDNGVGNATIINNIAEVDFVYKDIYYNALLNKTKGIKYAHKNTNSIVGRATVSLGEYMAYGNYGLWGEYYAAIGSSSMVYDLWDETLNTVFTVSEGFMTSLKFDDSIWRFEEGTIDEETKTWIVRPYFILKNIPAKNN